MNDLHPLSLCSSVATFGIADEGFALHVASGEEERTFRARVEFAFAFRAPPLVHLSLSGFDVDHADSARLRVHAESISEDGFEIVITTWLGTKVYSAEASWLAIGRSAR